MLDTLNPAVKVVCQFWPVKKVAQLTDRSAVYVSCQGRVLSALLLRQPHSAVLVSVTHHQLTT